MGHITQITGQTFQHRDLLKSYGGRWNQTAGSWEFDNLTAARLIMLRGLVGLVIVEPRAIRVARTDDADSYPRNGEPTLIIGDDPTYLNAFADQDPIAFFGFSSLSAFVDHVASLDRPSNEGWRCDAGWHGSKAYTATSNLAEAVQIARNGWSDGLALMERFTAPRARAKRRQHALAGGSVNVGRMLAGNPKHMIRRAPQPGNRVITLFVETVMWQGIKPSNAIIRALLIGSMIDRLEAEGYRCEVIATYCARRRDLMENYQTAVRLKSAQERLSLIDLTFAFGHPSFGRRLIYAMEGCTPQCSLQRDFRGIISQAFDDTHQPGKNEFYIPQISGIDQLKLTADPMSMLPLIEPDGLPITLRSE